jgi:putative flippase GtrA
MKGACARIAKFSLVGAFGIALQLSVLSRLTCAHVQYMIATGVAVESAILHNFLWHRRFTWPDRTRPGPKDFFRSLLRFHVSNGLISLAGNLLLMRVLVPFAKLPVLLANFAAIATCFLANFLAGDYWVFRWS